MLSLKCLVWKQRALGSSTVGAGSSVRAEFQSTMAPGRLGRKKGKKYGESRTAAWAAAALIQERGPEGPSPALQGWVTLASVCHQVSLIRKLHLVHHPLLRTLLLRCPCRQAWNDKQLWQGQQLIPGPHSRGLTTFPPTLCEQRCGPGAGECPRNDELGTWPSARICCELLQQPLLRHRGADSAGDKVMPWTGLVQEHPRPQHSLNGHLVPCSMTSVHTLVTQSKHTQQIQPCSSGSVPMDQPRGQDIAQTM